MNTNYFHKLLIVKKENAAYLLGIFTIVFIFGVFTTALPTFAMSMGSTTTIQDIKDMNPLIRLIEVDNPIYTPVDVSLDVVIAVLMIIALFVIIKSIREYGKSTIGISLLYFLIAVLILGTIRLIFILDDDGIYNTKDITEMTAWHFLFYYAVIIFYIAGKTLTGLVASDGKKSSYLTAIIFLIISIILSMVIIIFLPFPAINSFFVQYLQNTWFNTFGWFHIIALIMAASIAGYLYTVKSKFKGFTGVIGDIYISLGLLAALHLWELLNESWRLVIVSGDFGEFVERCLWIPVFIFILYSFIKLRRMTTSAPAAEPITGPSVGETPNSLPQSSVLSMDVSQSKPQPQPAATPNLISETSETAATPKIL